MLVFVATIFRIIAWNRSTYEKHSNDCSIAFYVNFLVLLAIPVVWILLTFRITKMFEGFFYYW